MSDPREQELLEIIRRKDEVIEQLRVENKLLREKIDLLVRKVFGSSSEALNPNQLELLSGAEVGKELAPGGDEPREISRCSERKSSKPRKPRLPEHLPVVEEVLDPLEVQACPENWKQMGEEVSEQLDYQPGKFFRRRLVRRKYVSNINRAQAPVIAPLPPVLQERCLAAPGLVAHVIVSKYCDHLPLYRQEQIYRQRYAVALSRQTLDAWVILAAEWLQPIYEIIRTGVMAGGYVQVDETPIRYLDPGRGKTSLGYLWTSNRPAGEVCYQWHTSRAAECLNNIVPVDFCGVLQSDGYAAYGSFKQSRENPLVLAGCWAHARRKFFEAQQSGNRDATLILGLIGHLYGIEKHLREARRGASGPALRQAIRSWQARPVLKRIKTILLHWKNRHRHLPQSNMGKAIDYALKHWEGLNVYVEQGQVEIDNNLVENAIRPTALGKKNWLFIGHEKAGQSSAVLYTIVENCRRQGLDPEAYLKEVLIRLPRSTNQNVHLLTPKALAQERKAKDQSQAA
jgi:transposase